MHTIQAICIHELKTLENCSVCLKVDNLHQLKQTQKLLVRKYE